MTPSARSNPEKLCRDKKQPIRPLRESVVLLVTTTLGVSAQSRWTDAPAPAATAPLHLAVHDAPARPLTDGNADDAVTGLSLMEGRMSEEMRPRP